MQTTKSKISSILAKARKFRFAGFSTGETETRGSSPGGLKISRLRMHKQREMPGEELCKNCMNIIWPARLFSLFPRRNCSHPASCNFRGSLVSGSTEENRKSGELQGRMENRARAECILIKSLKTPTLESLANSCAKIEELKRYVYFLLLSLPFFHSPLSPPLLSFFSVSFFPVFFPFFFFFIKQRDKTSRRIRVEKTVWVKE